MEYMNSFQRFRMVRTCRVPFASILMKLGLALLLFIFIQNLVFADQVTPSEAVKTSLNVRSAPSGEGNKVGKLLPGEKAELLSEVDDWYEVMLSNGVRGFVSKSYTIRIDEPVDEKEPVRDTRKDKIFIDQIHALSDSVKSLHGDLDSLIKYIEGLNVESKRDVLFQEPDMLLIASILAISLVVTLAFFITRLWHVKRRLRKAEQKRTEEGENGVEPVSAGGKKEEKLRRRSYFVVTTPRIFQTHGTFCTFTINVINSGDNPAISLKTSIFMIDIGSTRVTLFKEFHFSTANPIASKEDITFSEENIDFGKDCGPKFVCMSLDYSDSMINRTYQQRFTFKWNGIMGGEVKEDFENVDKERSLQVWLKFRELKWAKMRGTGM